MFIVCLSLFCQLSTQSKTKIIKLCSLRCVNVSSSTHDYNSGVIWDVGLQNNLNSMEHFHSKISEFPGDIHNRHLMPSTLHTLDN